MQPWGALALCCNCHRVDPLPRWRCLGRADTRQDLPSQQIRSWRLDREGNAWITHCAGCDLVAFYTDANEFAGTLEEHRAIIQEAIRQYERRQLDAVPQPPYLPPPPRGGAAAGPPELPQGH